MKATFIKHLFTNRWVIAVMLVTAFWAGRCSLPHAEHAHEEEQQQGAPAERVAREYTCSMHPSVRSNDPKDKCPICGMELIPVPQDDADDEPSDVPRLRVSDRAAALMEIQTVPVERRDVSRVIPLYGRIAFDETRLADVVARADGYIERLHINYRWQAVTRGGLVAEVYSPSIMAAWQELLLATRGTGGDRASATEPVRARLLRMGVGMEQIDEVWQSGDAPHTYRLMSPADGVVQELDVREGQWVQDGMRLMRLADATTVWAMFEAYETDIAGLKTGQVVRFTVQAKPGESFEGAIQFIDPLVDERTRTVRLRVDVPNPDLHLKPGMYVTGHAEVTHEEPALLIPASAPLITGRRALVYVRVPDTDRPTFEPRDILLGPRAGDRYVVYEGLEEGDLVVVNGQFKIDSELQIRGRFSMMAPRVDHRDDGPVEPVAVPGTFAEQIGQQVLHNYALVTALAGDDPDAARVAAQAALDHLEEMAGDPSIPQWSVLSSRMSRALSSLAGEVEIEKQRGFFETFSDALTMAVRLYGSGSIAPVQRAVCPMVQGRDGFWLQPDDDIRNPYFGASMLTCGYIRETLVAEPQEGHHHE